jgi:hypothetical protein
MSKCWFFIFGLHKYYDRTNLAYKDASPDVNRSLDSFWPRQASSHRKDHNIEPTYFFIPFECQRISREVQCIAFICKIEALLGISHMLPKRICQQFCIFCLHKYYDTTNLEYKDASSRCGPALTGFILGPATQPYSRGLILPITIN